MPNPFWGGVLFPLAVLGVLIVFPFLERRLTGDNQIHNLADRPRDHPFRTAFGVAFLSFVFLVFVFGSADRIYVLLGLSYTTQLLIFRIGIFVVPMIMFVLTRQVCRDLQGGDRVAAIQKQAQAEAPRAPHVGDQALVVAPASMCLIGAGRVAA